MLRLLISFPPPPPIKCISPSTTQHSSTRLRPKFPIRSASSSSSSSMESSSLQPSDQIAYDYSPFLRIYKDGHVERLKGAEIVPPSLDSNTQVRSKDVLFSPELNLHARLYLPAKINRNQKLPVLIYYHGGGFCVETPYSPVYHQSLNNIVAEANVIAVSVDYRRTPEHPLPIAYEDSWAALKWVGTHFSRGGGGSEEWLNDHADFGKVVLAGDSAGANIAHWIGLRYGEEKVDGIGAMDAVLIHPYFWGKDPIGNEPKEAEKRAVIDGLWRLSCPGSSGCDDPWINPAADPKLGEMGCRRMLVFVAGKDFLRDRGRWYCEKLKESGWGGAMEVVEDEEEGHVFHLDLPECDNAVALNRKIAAFINN